MSHPCLLLVVAWDWTIPVFGSRRSLCLMLAAFGLSLLDCTSSVTFLPFMARFKDRHLTPYLIGEGLSGFIPIVVAMIQGSVEETAECEQNSTSVIEKVGDTESGNTSSMSANFGESTANILFGPSVFFVSLLVTLLISWTAFFWLLYSPKARSEHVLDPKTAVLLLQERKENVKVNDEGESGAFDGQAEGKTFRHVHHERVFVSEEGNEVSDKEYLILQVVIVYACLSTFGVFPSLQPYSTLPYGNWTLLFTVIGTGLAYPVGCSMAMISDLKSIMAIIVFTVTGSLISLYLLTCAIMSPLPPLASNPITGGSITVTCWITYILLLSYVKTVVTLRMSRAKGENALYRVGIYTQIGSVVGAAFMFLAVNWFHWFHESSSSC